MSFIQTIYKSLPEGRSLLYGWFEAMHTRIDVIVCDVEEEKGNELIKKIQQETEKIGTVANRFDKNSELSLLNEKGNKQEVVASSTLFSLLEASIEGYKLTAECFDITIQSEEKVTKGINGIILNQQAKTVFLTDPGLQLDLCGIAKGYALDNCRELLQQEGIKDMFISFGNSSILAWGNHPCGTGWIVSGRENSDLPPITLYNEYLTISGNESTERAHILHPQTKTYIKGKKEIAVKTQSGTLGEILSTAYFVADPETRKWLEATYKEKATFYS